MISSYHIMDGEPDMVFLGGHPTIGGKGELFYIASQDGWKIDLLVRETGWFVIAVVTSISLGEKW